MRLLGSAVRRVACSGVVFAAAMLVRGQQPLAAPAPLAPPPPSVSAGELAVDRRAAERAHDFGLLTPAASLYRKLMDTPGADRTAHALALATVLLDAGDAAEAERVLATIPPPHAAAWQLRHGLAAQQLRKRDVAQAAWDSINPEELSAADRAWYIFLQAALYDTLPMRDRAAETKANELYNRAGETAANDLAKARFQLAAERVRLQFAPPSPEDLEQTRRVFEQNQGREISYDAARLYAVKLALLDRKPDAVKFLQEKVLQGMAALERGWRDEFNFLIGFFGDRGRGGAGRNALLQLLAEGVRPERQRQALQLLADASGRPAERALFRADLDRLITRTPAHGMREMLLYFRAQLAVAEKDYAAAEEHGQRLLRDFPESTLRAHVFGLLTQSAWEQQRYRLAAPNASKAREALLAQSQTRGGVARAELGILEAEAWFRAGDFRPAADAYAALLRERPPELTGEKLSAVMFQRVLAEIRSGSADAAKIIDELDNDPAFKVVDRWQAEWSLARWLQVQGKTAEAYERVTRLLAVQEAGASGRTLPAELRIRMAWLHAQLSFEANKPEDTLLRVEYLLKAAKEIEPALQDEIASTAILLQARAEFSLKREAAALQTLGRLRVTYPRTEAAIYSYLIEARYYSAQENITEAQVRLTRLVDNPDYKQSVYVQYALYQLALLSQELGQEKDLEEAYKRIDRLIAEGSGAGESELLFWARLKQGELLRQMSQFPQAQLAYEEILNRYSQRPDIVVAWLALADCHNAQSSADPTHADNAQLLFEQLRDRVDAPVDVRVEAGFKLGLLLTRRGQTAKAVEVWWGDVVTPFLIEAPQPFAAADKRRYWLARTLLDLGKFLEGMDRLEEARRAYALLLQTRLGTGETLAREALKRLGVPEANL